MSPENELAIQEEFSPVALDGEGSRIVKQASDFLLYEKPSVSWDTLIVGYEADVSGLESEAAIREAQYSRCGQAEHDPACLRALGATGLEAVSEARIILGTEEVSPVWDTPVSGAASPYSRAYRVAGLLERYFTFKQGSYVCSIFGAVGGAIESLPSDDL